MEEGKVGVDEHEIEDADMGKDRGTVPAVQLLGTQA